LRELPQPLKIMNEIMVKLMSYNPIIVAINAKDHEQEKLIA
jgi:hypothetical protein